MCSHENHPKISACAPRFWFIVGIHDDSHAGKNAPNMKCLVPGKVVPGHRLLRRGMFSHLAFDRANNRQTKENMAIVAGRRLQKRLVLHFKYLAPSQASFLYIFLSFKSAECWQISLHFEYTGSLCAYIGSLNCEDRKSEVILMSLILLETPSLVVVVWYCCFHIKIRENRYKTFHLFPYSSPHTIHSTLGT